MWSLWPGGVKDSCDIYSLHTYTCYNWASRFDSSPCCCCCCCGWHRPPLDHCINYIFINSSVPSWVVAPPSLCLCLLQLCRDSRLLPPPGIPQRGLGSSVQFLSWRVYKHRPQESTGWAKNCTGEGETEREGVQSLTAAADHNHIWTRRVSKQASVFVLLSLLLFGFWSGLRLSHMGGNGLRPQRNEGYRTTAGLWREIFVTHPWIMCTWGCWQFHQFSRMETLRCVNSLRHWTHSTWTGGLLHMCAHTHTHTQMHSGHTAGPAEVCVHVQEHSGG